MFHKISFKLFYIIIFFLSAFYINAQSSYTLNPSQKNEDCTKGAAGIQLLGLQNNDTLSIEWSNGQTGVYSIADLSADNYNVHIKIKHKLDTTITYNILNDKCIVGISNHFTPNDDNYNDLWQISNWNYYPHFELYVFNKWGQQVHSQKGNYMPWDGKWNGINALDGTYYYVFYYDGSNKHNLLKGDVTILR